MERDHSSAWRAKAASKKNCHQVCRSFGTLGIFRFKPILWRRFSSRC